MNNSSKIIVLLPVMLAFFVMGFVDLVGIAANYVKIDFNLSDTLTNLMPSMVFICFLVLAIPTSLLMNKIGRKKTVLLSMLITMLSLFIPLVSYSFSMMLVSFVLLGVGNTLMQVSLNPLLASIVTGGKMSSSLTFGQFIKAIASFLAPIIATWGATKLGDWRFILFPGFIVVAIIAFSYLGLTKIKEDENVIKATSFRECFSLLGDRFVLLLFIGIMVHVGLDVGINTTAPKVLIENLGITLTTAGFATSFYFIFRTTGCLIGSYLLAKFGDKKIFFISASIILIGILCLFFKDKVLIYIGIALFGLGNSNIFSILFSQALIRKPTHQNEVSGLMITGLVGGAIIPLLMGVASDAVRSQIGAIIVLIVCVSYLIIILSPKIKTN